MGALSEYSGLVVGVSEALAPSVTSGGSEETVKGIIAPVSVSSIGRGDV